MRKLLFCSALFLAASAAGTSGAAAQSLGPPPLTGTVTSVSVVTSNGIGGTVSAPTSTPAITITGAAPLASPTFTGTVTLPDAATWTTSGLYAGGAGITLAPASGSFPNALTIARKSGAASIEYSGTFLVAPSDGSGTEFDASAVTLADSGYHNCMPLTTNSLGLIGCTGSDARLKVNQGLLAPKDALAFALQIPVRQYKFIDPTLAHSDDRQHLGYFAQDILRSAPKIAASMVGTTGATPLTQNGTFTVDYAQAGPIALAAIKALQGEIDTLRAENRAIRAQLVRGSSK